MLNASCVTGNYVIPEAGAVVLFSGCLVLSLTTATAQSIMCGVLGAQLLLGILTLQVWTSTRPHSAKELLGGR